MSFYPFFISIPIRAYYGCFGTVTVFHITGLKLSISESCRFNFICINIHDFSSLGFKTIDFEKWLQPEALIHALGYRNDCFDLAGSSTVKSFPELLLSNKYLENKVRV